MDPITYTSDTAVLEEMGRRLSRRRLDLQMTQARLAREAGVSKRTVERLEDGAPVQTTTLVRVYRALGLLENLDEFLPVSEERPMELLRHKGKIRQRTSSPRKTRDPESGWKWGDEE